MKAKLDEYLLDFVEKELSQLETASVAREVAASATLRAEVADIQAVRAEIKNTQSLYAVSETDWTRLHKKIMFQVESEIALKSQGR